MEANLAFMFVLIAIFIASDRVQAQDQTGFMSLDCGLIPKEKSYTEKSTNITYISDARFVETGESKSIKPEYQPQFQQQAWVVRSFPEGIRNCYNLNVTKDAKYLIRASFVYGDYDDQNVLPSFDLYLGPNRWTSVEIKGVINGTFPELIHIAASSQLQVCLVKTGTTTPFISSLELRPLNSKSYVAQSGALVKLFRVSLTTARGVLRFDEDIHDRSWGSYFKTDWTELSTTLHVGTTTIYELPQAVVRTAATPTNASEPLTIFWSLENPDDHMYVYMHFAEIELLKTNETREFNITLNGKHWDGPFIPDNFSVITSTDPRAESCKNGECEFSFIRTERSTHPPLLNAIEAYTVLPLSTLETDKNDVEAIKNIKAAYELDRISWQGDPCAPREYMWDGLNCSLMNSEPPRITSLTLSSSGLRGKITPYVEDLKQLTALDLSNNNLTGEFPKFLAKMESLSFINLSGNNLNGSVPETILEKQKDGSLKLNVEGNQNLCAIDSCNPKRSKNLLIPIVAAGASLVLLIAAVAIFFIFRNRKRKQKIEGIVQKPSPVMSKVEPGSNNSSAPSIATTERRYPYAEVMRMTNNFQKVLGRGGFGEVYRGFLNDNNQVAVKLLSQSSSQGYRQFKAEVELLLRVHHRNLVSLVGYCDEGDYLALIYEYMANGDLNEHLSGKHGSNVLSWADRLRIAAEAAQGLEYLHNGCKPPIVHRDVKTTNILLSERFQAKLADFGLSRSFPVEGDTHVSTVVAGTPGYLDPEYYRTNWLMEKSDVYSFGIVLLEIITNQRVIDKNRERPHITEWVSVMLSRGDIRNIVDPKLQGGFDTNTAWKALELAMTCVNHSSSKRPTMTHVVVELNECYASENISTRGSRETDSKSSLELSMSFRTEYNPGAR